MELRQLEYFAAVAEELHFGHAAQKLHVAEQPLGYQIRKLEDELGFKLFERTTRSVTLTPAGASLFADARDILTRTRTAADDARRIAEGKAGVVRLGYESATVPAVLPDFVKLFRAEYPEIDLVLVEHVKDGLTYLGDEDDACIVVRYERLPSWVDFFPIHEDQAVVALPIEDPLAELDEVPAAALAGKPFLGYADASSDLANRFMAHLSAQGDLELSITQETGSYMALMSFVAAGFGCSAMAESMSGLFPDRIAYRPLVEPAVSVEHGLAIPKGNETPILTALRTVARHLKRIL